MKKQRLRANKVINHTNFNIEILNETDGRHILKLLSKSNVNNCLVVCKYKEYNETSTNSEVKFRYTPIKYLQSVQIKSLSKSKGVKVYEIISYPQTKSITVTYNNSTPFDITYESSEFNEFQSLLSDLSDKLDKFSTEYIKNAVESVMIGSKINQTPECVENIVKFITEIEHSWNIT